MRTGESILQAARKATRGPMSNEHIIQQLRAATCQGCKLNLRSHNGVHFANGRNEGVGRLHVGPTSTRLEVSLSVSAER